MANKLENLIRGWKPSMDQSNTKPNQVRVYKDDHSFQRRDYAIITLESEVQS